LASSSRKPASAMARDSEPHTPRERLRPLKIAPHRRAGKMVMSGSPTLGASISSAFF